MAPGRKESFRRVFLREFERIIFRGGARIEVQGVNHSKYSSDCEPTEDSDAFTLVKESNIIKKGEMRRYMIMPLMEKDH